MGKALIAASSSQNHLELIGISRNPPLKDLFIPTFTLEEAPLHSLDLLLDVSNFSSLEENLKAALSHNIPIVIGTTQHDEKEFSLMQLTSKKIPVLYSSNFSIGIHLIKSFITQHAALLEESFIDIFETHHLEKKDLPSGTALDFARLFDKKKLLLSIDKKRSKDDIVIHSTRIPFNAGEHTVQFTFQEETLSIHHQIKDRKIYAHGALLAAQFLIKQQKGFYTFSDVFVR